MILLMCLWHRSVVQTLFFVLVWPVAHYFLMFSLNHVTLTAHVSGCCQRQGSRVVTPCKRHMREAVRTLLTFTHSLIIPSWGALLLITKQYDVESNSYLQLMSLCFHIYSFYWNLREFSGVRHGHSQRNHSIPQYSRKTVLLHLMHNGLCVAGIYFCLRAVSREMLGWRNSVMDLMDLSVTWKNPTSTQRRVLSQHLLAKTSDISWVLTLHMVVHEGPNIFYHMIALLRMTPNKSSEFQSSTWTPTMGHEKSNAERAASLGAAAWKRERGGNTGLVVTGMQNPTNFEGWIRTAHFLSFAGLRVVGGLITLRRILGIEDIVKDTSFLTAVLLHYGLALYLFGGFISFATKRMTRRSERIQPKRSISWRLMTSVSDEWLQ